MRHNTPHLGTDEVVICAVALSLHNSVGEWFLPELSCYYRGSRSPGNHAHLQHTLDVHLLPAVGCVAERLLQQAGVGDEVTRRTLFFASNSRNSSTEGLAGPLLSNHLRPALKQESLILVFAFTGTVSWTAVIQLRRKIKLKTTKVLWLDSTRLRFSKMASARFADLHPTSARRHILS